LVLPRSAAQAERAVPELQSPQAVAQPRAAPSPAVLQPPKAHERTTL
jgi:hypothetical protein